MPVLRIEQDHACDVFQCTISAGSSGTIDRRPGRYVDDKSIASSISTVPIKICAKDANAAGPETVLEET